jgi:hypothetical protein
MGNSRAMADARASRDRSGSGSKEQISDSSAATRRRLQNRVNQRAHRQRKAEEKARKIQVFELHFPIPIIPTIRRSSATDADNSASNSDLSIRLYSEQPKWATSASWIRHFKPELVQRQIGQQEYVDAPADEDDGDAISFEESFLHYLKESDFQRLPGDDHLLSLMYYNVFRALTWNVRMLGLDTVLMHTDDYPSPFNIGTADLASTPPWLRPTELQRTVIHHPCFDIFPDPVVRDNGIKGTAMLPHGTLCMTLAGRNTWFENERDRRTGLVIWGPPEDAMSWEVTEGFVRSWGWLVKGSHVLECSTNRWRWTRGEEPIFFA